MRSLESYNKHLSKIKRCGVGAMQFCKESDLLKPFIIIRCRCHSDYCVICRRSNLIKLRNALIHSFKKERWRLCTLTFDQSEITGDERFATIHKAFDKFMKRIRRSAKNVKFAKALEIHKSGYPHIHLLVSHYLPHKFVEKSWFEVGGGDVDIREGIKCKLHFKKACRICFYDYEKLVRIKAAQYITDEFEKTFQDPHKLGYDFYKHSRRSFSTSRNLKLKYDSCVYSFFRSYETWEDALEYAGAAYPDTNIHVDENCITIDPSVHDNINRSKYHAIDYRTPNAPMYNAVGFLISGVAPF